MRERFAVRAALNRVRERGRAAGSTGAARYWDRPYELDADVNADWHRARAWQSNKERARTLQSSLGSRAGVHALLRGDISDRATSMGEQEGVLPRMFRALVGRVG